MDKGVEKQMTITETELLYACMGEYLALHKLHDLVNSLLQTRPEVFPPHILHGVKRLSGDIVTAGFTINNLREKLNEQQSTK